MEQAPKREAVMRAAMELVGERGFHGSPMAMIAERAGVAAGTIYRFFDSKDTLIKEVYEALDGQVMAAVSEGFPAGSPARERFLHVWRRLIRYFIASPLEFRFLEQFHNSPYGVACRRDKVFGRKDPNPVAQLFQEALEQRVIKDLPLPVLFALSFGPIVGLCRDHILEFVTLDDRLIEETVEACWDAIRREPETARA